MFKKLLRTALALIAALLLAGIVALVATAPTTLQISGDVPTITGSAARYLAATERQVADRTPIAPNTEKRIRWFNNNEGQRTRYAIVYLHGFSATRQEIAPVSELVADRIEANLFETRLAGHGQGAEALIGVTAEDWLDDASESLAIGTLLGERLIVIGTSTGATLALAMSSHELFANVESLVMLSPNFAPRDRMAELLVWPGGPQLARLLLGETRSWTAANDLQQQYWSTSYPVSALVEMMRLVTLVRAQLPIELNASVMTFFSPEDQVVSIDQLRSSIAQIGSPRFRTTEIASSGDPANHVLAGDILAPENNERVVTEIVRFITEANQ